MRVLYVFAGLAVASAAFAQSAPDVPENHWASRAVSDLYRLGILRGYPDGLFRGNRPVSRYELGVALNNFLGVQQKSTEELALAIKNLNPQPQSVEGIAEIRRRLDTLETQFPSTWNEIFTGVGYVKKSFDSLETQMHKLREELRIMREKRQ